MPRFLEATDFKTQVCRWEVFNRPSMKRWSARRVVCVGDAVHPVSPYAAYGMGMAIEDGYFLARALDGVERLVQRLRSTRLSESTMSTTTWNSPVSSAGSFTACPGLSQTFAMPSSTTPRCFAFFWGMGTSRKRRRRLA
jgi:hypothetical protein